MLAGYGPSTFNLRLWRLKTLPSHTTKILEAVEGCNLPHSSIKYVAWQEVWLPRCRSHLCDEFLLLTSYTLTIS